jgi:hypothetical protein
MLASLTFLTFVLCAAPAEESAEQPKRQGHGRRQGLAHLCTRSLLTYHSALSNWFTGATDASEFDGFLRNLSLSSAVTLQDPSGRVFDYNRLVQTLKKIHGREPAGQVHSVDLRSVSVADHQEESVTINFREKLIASNGMLKALIATTAICDASTTSESGFEWRSFVETRLPKSEERAAEEGGRGK